MNQISKSQPILLHEYVKDFEQTSRKLETRCWQSIPTHYGSNTRHNILRAIKRLRMYLEWSEAGTHECLEATVQARHYRQAVHSAAQSYASALTEMSDQGYDIRTDHIELGADIAAWASRKVPTFPVTLNSTNILFNEA